MVGPPILPPKGPPGFPGLRGQQLQWVSWGLQTRWGVRVEWVEEVQEGYSAAEEQGPAEASVVQKGVGSNSQFVEAVA
jgi:hypothetical protein